MFLDFHLTALLFTGWNTELSTMNLFVLLPSCLVSPTYLLSPPLDSLGSSPFPAACAPYT